VADDVVADPALAGERRQLLARHVEAHVGAEVGDPSHRDPSGIVLRPLEGLGDACPHPAADALTVEALPERAGSGDQRDHVGSAVLGDFDLEVVDVAGEQAVPIDHLVVEQVQRGEEHSGGHWPPLVMIMRGIVASATNSRMTRYTVATAFSARPLVSVPM
jgi:hypothetical protein